MAFSPDGTQLVYSAERNGVYQLYLRPIDQAEGKPIPGTEGGVCPFFSPDGKWVGFIGSNGLTKVPIGGGAPVVLCEAFPRGASWGPDDTIVFPRSSTSGLWKISAAGGTPQVLTTLDSTNREKSHLWPEILPGGKAVIFAASTRLGFLEAEQPGRRGHRGAVARNGQATGRDPGRHLRPLRSDRTPGLCSRRNVDGGAV